MAARTDDVPRPLLVAADAVLLDELLRLVAAAGTEAFVAPDPAAARPHWAHASVVLVGADLAGACVRARLPRRAQVVVATTDQTPDDALWELAGELGADHVAALPAAEPWLIERLDAAGRGRSTAHVVGVVGGRGGAGASVLAAGLAITAARAGGTVLLVDADPLGGGIDLVLGWEDVGGLRWPELAAAPGRVSPTALCGALPRDGRLLVLSWDRAEPLAVDGRTMAGTLDAARRGVDLVVVDLPRAPDEAAVRALQQTDRTLLVVPAELRACAAAARVAARIGQHSAHLAAVVRGPAPGGLRPREVAGALGLPLAGVLRPETGLPAALERGQAPAATGRGPLAALCRRLLADVARSSAEDAA